jgi:hypothetical protein
MMMSIGIINVNTHISVSEAVIATHLLVIHAYSARGYNARTRVVS